MQNILGLHHVAIRATNFEETIKFYVEGLGFKLKHEWSLPEFNLQQAAMLVSPDGTSYLEIFDKDADIAAQGRKKNMDEAFVQTSILHLSFRVKNAEKAYEAAKLAGATSCVEPMELELGVPPMVVRNALVCSPNGEVLEFIESNAVMP